MRIIVGAFHIPLAQLQLKLIMKHAESLGVRTMHLGDNTAYDKQTSNFSTILSIGTLSGLLTSVSYRC